MFNCFRAKLDNLTGQFVNCFGSLYPEQLNWKPNSQTWSIAQNMEHLMVVNETYYPVLEQLKSGIYKKHPLLQKLVLWYLY